MSSTPADAPQPSRLRRLTRTTWRWTRRLALVLLLLAFVYITVTNYRGSRAVARMDTVMIDRNMPTDVQDWRHQHFDHPDPARATARTSTRPPCPQAEFRMT